MYYMNYIKRGEKEFYVSTANTFDAGWETMVFETDGNKNVVNWGELYGKRYSSQEEASAGHKDTVENFRKENT